MLRKNKNLRKQLQQLEQAQQEQQPALTDTPGTVQVYPYQATEGGTEYTGPSSPRQDWGSYKPPASPSMPEVEGNPQRYSELDAATATGSVHVYNAPGSPTIDESHVSTPFQSPQQNPQGFQPSQQLQPPQSGQPPHGPGQLFTFDLGDMLADRMDNRSWNEKGGSARGRQMVSDED